MLEHLQSLHGKWILLFCFFLAFTQANTLNSLPKGVHQWAQADRFAMAERFTEDRGFFHPATYSLISDDGEVGVEFPLLPFLAGKLSKWLQLNAYLPLIYRILTFGLLLWGLLSFIQTHLRASWLEQMIAGVLVLSSPVLLFYGYNFLPDAAALGLVLWSFSYTERQEIKWFIASLALLTLATLLKTSSGIYLLAYVGAYIFKQDDLTVNRGKVFRLAAFVLCIAIIATYDYFHIYIRNQQLWSTLFLSKTNRISSGDELMGFLSAFWSWKFEYLNIVQWLIVLAAAFAFLYKMKSKESSNHLYILWIGGLISIAYLFGVQFINHDYYILATFMPVFIYLMVKGIDKFMTLSFVGRFPVLAILAVMSFSIGSTQHFNRNNETVEMRNGFYTFHYHWLERLAQDRDLEKDAVVFVVYEMEPNLSLCYLDRKGIVFNREEMGREESNFYYWYNRRQPDYVLCRKENLELFRKQHSAEVSKYTVHKQTEDYTLFKTHGH